MYLFAGTQRNGEGSDFTLNPLKIATGGVTTYDLKNKQNLRGMFSDSGENDQNYSYVYANLPITSIDLSEFDTKDVTRIDYMLERMPNLEYLDFSGVDFSSVVTSRDSLCNINSRNHNLKWVKVTGCNEKTKDIIRTILYAITATVCESSSDKGDYLYTYEASNNGLGMQEIPENLIPKK